MRTRLYEFNNFIFSSALSSSTSIVTSVKFHHGLDGWIFFLWKHCQILQRIFKSIIEIFLLQKVTTNFQLFKSRINQTKFVRWIIFEKVFKGCYLIAKVYCQVYHLFEYDWSVKSFLEILRMNRKFQLFEMRWDYAVS